MAAANPKGAIPLRHPVPALLLLAAFGTHGQSGVPDLVFHGGRMMGDVRVGGMATSGSGLASGAFSVWSNPALVDAYCREQKLSGLVSGLSYAHSGSLYDGHVVSGGAGYHGEEKGTIVNMYRYLQGNGEPQTDYQSVITYAGQMFDRGERQGPVNYGVNIRYEQANWKTTGLPTLYSGWLPPDSTEWQTYDSVAAPPGSLLERRLMLDLGFFQSNILTNLDLGLVFHNLFGYVWREIRPTAVQTVSYHDVDTADTVTWTYRGDYRTENGWTDSWHRRMTVGLAFHSNVLPGRLAVRVPLDVEFVGLFERERETHVMFRCGAEVELKEILILRGGYGREPDLVEYGRNPKNEHVYGGGLGVRWRGLHVDAFLTNREWGFGASFDY